jgi:hypothetical protein
MKPINPAVQQANQELRAAYAKGCELLEQMTERVAHGTAQEFADRQNTSAERLRKLRQIAKVYTPAQFEDLLRLCVRYDRPIGVSYLYKLVSVPVKNKQRYGLQIDMLRERWSRGELDRQIVARFGRKNSAGRLRSVPKDRHGLLSQIESDATRWLRWQEELLKQVNVLDHSELLDLFQRMSRLNRGMEKLQALAADLLQASRELTTPN